MGPYTARAGMEKVAAWIDRALAEGAKMVFDGRVNIPQTLSKGYFLGPTILENIDVDMATAKEEAFGAVAGLIRADNLDQVIEWINTKTDLGHSACIMTESGRGRP